MNARAALAAGMSDPECNRQFRRWPAPARGNDQGEIRAWHAPDAPAPVPMTSARRRAELAWRRIAREVAP